MGVVERVVLGEVMVSTEGPAVHRMIFVHVKELKSSFFIIHGYNPKPQTLNPKPNNQVSLL